MQFAPPSSPAATAAREWPCATLLAEHLTHAASAIRGRAVIELGSGVGAAALAATSAGARHVCLTDLPENLPQLHSAVQRHDANLAAGREVKVSVCALDWTTPLPAEVAAERFDLVLCADCVFWPALFSPLLSTLGALCTDGHQRVLLAAMDRQGRAREFVAAAKAAGWVSTRLDWPSPRRALPEGSLEALRRDQCHLYEMRRSCEL